MIYVLSFFLLLFTVPTVLISSLALLTPDPSDIEGCFTTKMNSVFLCPTSESYTPLSETSEALKNAILLSEDVSFYHHKGFDWHEVSESVKTNILRWRFARGGSTITQQLAKNAFLSGKKSLGRKIQEAFVAQKIENILSKDEIFERYLNVVEFGKGIYGIGPAAFHYFGKSPKDLNLLESVFLAYLLPNPKQYSKVFETGELTEFATNRLTNLIKRLENFKRIEEEQKNIALELLPRFPWFDLTDRESAMLTGQIGQFDDPIEEELFEFLETY